MIPLYTTIYPHAEVKAQRGLGTCRGHTAGELVVLTLKLFTYA